jgi:N-acetylglutamate synthase/N-acetylornithine aminotransferase
MRKDDGKDAEAASKFVNSLPSGANKDAGAQQIARNIAREAPQDAAVWAGVIQDPELRSDTLIDVGRNYMRTNPQEAAAWLATSGLTAEQQQQVTQPPDRGDWRGFGGPGGGGPPGGGRGGRGR